MIEILKRAEFETLAASSTPQAVLFGAPWCSQCKPVKSKLQHRTDVRYLDVDRFPEVATRLGIRSLPTVVIFAHGAPQRVLVAPKPNAALAALDEAAA